MAQKINPNIFRLGIKKKEWKAKYFENTKEEFSLYTYQSLEIKKFIQKFLANHGLIFHDFKLQYSANNIYLFISYYTTFKTTLLINKINVKQTICLKKHNFYKKTQLKKKIIKQQFLTKKFNFLVEQNNTNNKFKKNYIKKLKYNKKTKKVIQKYLKKRIQIMENYKTHLKLKHYKNIKQLKLNNFSEQILEIISLYTNKKFNIYLTFQNINKGLSLNLTNIQEKYIKKKLLELRRESKNLFFKETINILIISVIRKNSAQLLAEFIAYQLSSIKRHNFFLIFVKRFLNTIISEKKISNVSGIKVAIKGRFNGAPRAHKRIYESGSIPTQMIDSDISYYQATSYTPNGTFGVKVWICQNLN